MSAGVGRPVPAATGRALQHERGRGVLPGVQGAGADRDDEICRRLAEDLDGGFVGLVEAYGRIVLTVAARAAPVAEDAEDLAAEAFLRAYRALRRYDPARIRQLRVRPWLVTIVLNASRNARRDAARRPRTDPLAAGHEPVSPTRDAAELAETADAVRELAARLGSLPAKRARRRRAAPRRRPAVVGGRARAGVPGGHREIARRAGTRRAARGVRHRRRAARRACVPG